MDNAFPVYTTPNECQDCYKCVRQCACKAIKIVNSRAAVMPELCVSCGLCVKVCPAHAKKIRSDLGRAKFLLASGEKLYASIAPSFIGYFRNLTIGQLCSALKQLGFAECGETALGAQLVSAQTAKFLKTAPNGIYLSSCCPAAVDYISKYHHEFLPAIVPVVSPVIAHCRLVHEKCGREFKTVFIGPCAAKKNEADRNPDDLSLAITFEALEKWFKEAGIELGNQPESPLFPEPAQEGRNYSIEGGMNDTIRQTGDGVRYITVSGLLDLERMLSGSSPDNPPGGGKLFIEMLACDGGCINGPVMRKNSSDTNIIMKTLSFAPAQSSVGRPVPVTLDTRIDEQNPPKPEPTEEEIRAALESVGKFTAADELNCGGCGYNTCREFAKAKLQGKAEPAMCLSYLRKISQKTSNALIRYIPVGVVIADQDLQVVECNRNFARLCGEDTLEAYDTCGNLNGALLNTMIEFTDLFEAVLDKGGELERFNQLYGDRIYNISVFSITPGQTVGAVIQDVTRSELQREQIAEKAREVIRENVATVQRIASALGEHMAKTEVLLDEVAGSYSEHHLERSGERVIDE